MIEQWQQEYNQRGPHSSLGCLMLVAFAEQAQLSLELVQSLAVDHPTYDSLWSLYVWPR